MRKPDDVMPAPTARLFARLENEPLLRGFFLIGGTALSLHLGHRLSEDLDFIFPRHKLPVEVLRVLVSRLADEGWDVARNDDPAASDDFLQAGMELRDYSQSFILDRKVSVTFFAGDDAQQRVLESPKDQDSFAVATLEDLFALKAMVASSRSKSRDWLDLYLLCKDHGFGIDQWRAVYQKTGLSDSQFERALDRIIAGHTSSTDPGFDSLLPSAPSLEEISVFFKRRRQEYEVAEARKRLGG